MGVALCIRVPPNIVYYYYSCLFMTTYPDLAELGGHHQRRHAVVVVDLLQVAFWVEFGALDEQQVVHLGDEAGVIAGVIGHVHQRV